MSKSSLPSVMALEFKVNEIDCQIQKLKEEKSRINEMINEIRGLR